MSYDRFVAALLGFERGFGPNASMGFHDRNGDLVAGVVFHNWQPEYGVIEVSAAALSPKWLTRARMNTVAEYVFDGIECRMVVARHSERNTIARKLWDRLGAREIRMPKLRGPDEDEMVALLTREEWKASRFAKGSNGWTKHTVAA